MKIIHIHNQFEIIHPASSDGKQLMAVTAKCEQRAVAWGEKHNLNTIWYSRPEKRVYGFIKKEMK